MPDDIRTNGEPSMVSLAHGILNDAQELFRQQLALFKAELREDLRKTREAALSLSFGICLAFFGVLLLLFACAYLLNWAGLPVWAGFGVVGGIALVIGLVLLVVGKKRLASINPLPGQSVQALRENVQWITNRK
jgi:Flp pilus assembly protein TadB